MSFLPSLPDPTNLGDVLKAFPKGVPELLAYHDVILRGPSPLKIAERELIAAYVSGLNACRFCYNAHTVYAERFGIEPQVFEAALAHLDTAPLDARMKPILRLAKKLTEAPESVVAQDHQAIIEAGWPQEAVADVIYITALFNFMNRVVSGFGVEAFDEVYDGRRQAVRKMSPERRQALNESQLGTDEYVKYGRGIGAIKD
ncbi:MAG: peroxidase-related enzyme [Proteobacteria bacterium]|nr:peroxidase-related enzyme [Pseudomonadota bacterium]